MGIISEWHSNEGASSTKKCADTGGKNNLLIGLDLCGFELERPSCKDSADVFLFQMCS